MPTYSPKLIVGWPRGGLGYIANLLRLADQAVGFSFDHTTNYSNLSVRLADANPYELSSALPPFLGHPDLQKSQVFFVVRDPMRVLNSLHFHGSFHCERRTPALMMACKHLPGFQKDYWAKPLQAIVRFMIGWYDLIVSKRPDVKIVRVEDGTIGLLKQLTGEVRRPLPYCEPEFNASGCRQTIVPSHLAPELQRPMRDLLRRLGYLESVWDPRGGHAHYVNPDWHC